MQPESARKGLRVHIGIFGRRNAGKSSLLNAITRQQVSIVSALPGTTTDPVEKPMELLPLGPVLFIDTAGIDDSGALGDQRIAKTRQVIERTDLALLVCAAGAWSEFEAALLEEFARRKTPVVVVFNKSDVSRPSAENTAALQSRGVRWVETVATECRGLLDLRQAILDVAPGDLLKEPDLIGDLIQADDLVILVVPIDKEAPRGRLIVPQVQTIRNLLDNDAMALVVKERELRSALTRLKRPPALVVTDSQAFLRVAGDTPPEVKLTSFSILFARLLGDLVEQVRGATAIEALKSGDRVLIAESCAHHPIADDIGRVKIPRWLNQYAGGALQFEHVQGHDFDRELERYQLVVHCGACMSNRREVLSRIMRCQAAGVPITNYGLAIAYSLGIFERALQPFPAALDVFRQSQVK